MLMSNLKRGYIVAAPSSYHDFVGPEPLAYDVPGTDLGNDLKVKKVGTVSLTESLRSQLTHAADA